MRRAPIRVALGLGAGLVLLFGGGFGAFVASLDRYEREPPGRADGIVALTGGSGRIGDAIDLLARGYGGRLLITGVNERTSRQEIARLNPHQRRLVECCVDLDYRARNTVGNAAETSGWARRNGFASLILVTSNYHMPRSLLELGRSMPEAHATPFAVVTDNWGWRAATVRLLLSEYVKFLGAYARRAVSPVTVASSAHPRVPAAGETPVTSAIRKADQPTGHPARVATGATPG